MRLPGFDTPLYPLASAGGVVQSRRRSVDGPRGPRRLCFCFALPSGGPYPREVARLAEICRRETGIPAVNANVRHAPAKCTADAGP
jgi:hypothetical protein